VNPGYPTLSLAERDRRWAVIRRLLADQGMDALLVFGLKGRERFEGYVANEQIEGMAIVPRESDPVLLTWHPKMVIRRLGSRTDASRFWIKDVRIGKYGANIARVLKERGLEKGRIGVTGLEVPEPGCPDGIVPYPTWSAVLSGLPDARFRDMTWEMRELMLVKSDEEMAVLRHCGRIGEQACRAMIDAVKPGATEHEVYAAIQDAIHRNGAVPRDPFLIMTWGRDDLGWFEPGWTWQGGEPRKVERGDVIMAELFPAYGGLETQQQMCIAVAPVEPAVMELAAVARQCYEAGLAALKPGNTFKQVADAMVEPVSRIGGWTLTPEITSMSPTGWVGGMGINLEAIPEKLAPYWSGAPVVGSRELVLRERMTMAFEANASKGQRRVNTGCTVVVGKERPEELNTLPNRMHVAQ
jgi:Xaa-Pro aminopeptidase